MLSLEPDCPAFQFHIIYIFAQLSLSSEWKETVASFHLWEVALKIKCDRPGSALSLLFCTGNMMFFCYFLSLLL